MSEIEIKRTVVSRSELSKVVDTEFTTFLDQPTQTLLSIEDFFAEYERLFFEIPSEGPTNSHEYLARRSGEQANLDNLSQEIQPLLDEIANLREQLIEANVTIASLQGTS